MEEGGGDEQGQADHEVGEGDGPAPDLDQHADEEDETGEHGAVAAPIGPHQLGPPPEEKDDRREQQRADVANHDEDGQPPGEDAQPDTPHRADAEEEGVGGGVDRLAELGHRAPPAGDPAIDGVQHPDGSADEDPEDEPEAVRERPGGAEQERRAEPGADRRQPVGHPVDVDPAAVGADQHGGAPGHDQRHHQPAAEGHEAGDDPSTAVQLGDHQGERLTGDQPEREPAVQRVAQPRAGAEPL